MVDSAQSSNLTNAINYLLDNILGLDKSSKIVEVFSSPALNKAGMITIDVKFVLGAWPKDLADFIKDFPGLKLFSIDVDPAKLTKDRNYVIDVQKDIQGKLNGFVTQYVGKAAEGISGPERAVATTATAALQDLLSSKIVEPLSGLLSTSLLALDLPNRADVTKILGDAFDTLNSEYFKAFLPGLSKTYAKLGLSEILTTLSSGATPDWAKVIHDLGDGVLGPVLDNIVDNYFLTPGSAAVNLLNGVKFTESLGKAITGLLVDFNKLDKKIIDDILGIDGSGYLETQISQLLSSGINNFVNQGFVDAVKFLSGNFDALNLEKLFDNFTGQFSIASIQNILSGFLANYSGTKLAELFITIDSLPEALVSQLGSTIASSAFGKAIGSIGFDAFAGIFGEAAASAIGAGIFNGLGALLGAGAGAIVGSVVFDFLDGLFDGAISGFIGDIIDFFKNDSPQAFYGVSFHPETNSFEYVPNSSYHKDDKGSKILDAVTQLAKTFQDKVNDIIDFVGQPATINPAFDYITAAWGKKHLGERFNFFKEGREDDKIAYTKDAEAAVTTAIGAVLRHIDFQTGNKIIAKAYDAWKAEIGTASADVAFVSTDAFVLLQNLIGLARFSNDYRQDPDKFDALIASDAAIGVTILQQYLAAESRGFNVSTTLRGTELKREEIGSAAAGDTIYLDGPAWRAKARGGDDTIYIGLARKQEVDGGTGTDTIVLAKARGAYSFKVTDRAAKQVVITDNAAGIVITVSAVELFNFNGVALSFEQAFPNQLPVITSNGGSTMAAVSIAENGVVVTTVAATDGDGDPRAYSITGGADASLFRIDAATGVLSFLTAPDFEAPGDAGRNNVYDVSVSVSDGFGSVNQAIAVRVTNLIEGTREGNVIIGTAGNDVIGAASAPSGEPFTTVRDDVILGNGGDDTAYGGDGADRLFGGAGDDVLGGDSGDDLVEGEEGNDKLYGGTGADTLRGGPGRDLLLGDAGDDVLDGGQDNDSVFGFDGNDLLAGGDGNDNLNGEVGDDILTGGAGVDILTGGPGADRFRDTAAGLNGDTITDFNPGDRIVISDAVVVGFRYALSGNTQSFTGGSLTLSKVTKGYNLGAKPATGAGIELSWSSSFVFAARGADFNGDGRDDILWRHLSGAFSNWLGQANGGFVPNDGAAYTPAPANWKIVATGDFNGDRRADILWRSDTGALSDWLGKANGGFTPNDAAAFSQVPTSWKVAGTGDFNGDGRDDILWRNEDGTTSNWLGRADGGFSPNDAKALTLVPNTWQIAAVGDFNGDGRSDILWRNVDGTISNWLGKTDGGFTVNDAAARAAVPTNWHVIGTGDFNGDGRSDILWRNDDGTFSNWLGRPDGGFSPNDAAALNQIGLAWQVVGTGDFNGDGRDDLLWRNGDGALSNWLGRPDGGFSPNDAHAFSSVPPEWQVQPTIELVI